MSEVVPSKAGTHSCRLRVVKTLARAAQTKAAEYGPPLSRGRPNSGFPGSRFACPVMTGSSPSFSLPCGDEFHLALMAAEKDQQAAEQGQHRKHQEAGRGRAGR